MSNPYVQLIAYLASLAACSVLVFTGKLDQHVLTVVIGAAIPGPGSSLIAALTRGRSNPPPPH